MAKTTWKYTLREIIIVIIGITIAFSMNKCADNLKDNKLRKEYLTNLKSDVEADQVQLLKNIEAIDNKIKICSEIIPVLNSEKDQDMRLMNNIFAIIKYENFSPKNITYKTLINSGDLKLIDDFKLKTAIQQHYTNYEELSEVYMRHTSLIKDYLGNYLVNHADYDQIQNGKAPFLNEIKLKNIVRALLTTFDDKKATSKLVAESCDTLIKEIDTALDYY
ncbi:hypothetical protein H8K90_01575 [Winogradskyella echinorum]|uniref:Lipoprotein n=1 Tax=Winogradskyella echinorum TaxID=538189 RepID=A0ABR6XX54_9FLAO|nr:DUF6090 family protein [Winogradskyella echinorum]MBC3845055.1 hypothetical protein [Winogradskyella echinorum]MBC5749403.1 hypothetical protein [Winogradskyella echinorum]